MQGLYEGEGIRDSITLPTSLGQHPWIQQATPKLGVTLLTRHFYFILVASSWGRISTKCEPVTTSLAAQHQASGSSFRNVGNVGHTRKDDLGRH